MSNRPADMDAPGPVPDILSEAERILGEAEAGGIVVRLLGGIGVALRCPSVVHPELRREYRDLDVAGRSKQREQITALFTELGYEADRSFNALRGHQRLLFLDRRNGRHVDVMFDRLRMSHTIEFGERLATDERTLPLAELLLFKLQIVEANEKDLTDAIALLGDHPLGDGDGEVINVGHIARLAADDWGLHHTLEQSIARVRQRAQGMDVELPFSIEDQANALLDRLDREPKSTRWKLRARIGERVRWYELPEEVRE